MSRILATAARLCPPLTIRTASSLNSNVYRALGLPISVPPCSSLNPQQGRHSSGATSLAIYNVSPDHASITGKIGEKNGVFILRGAENGELVQAIAGQGSDGNVFFALHGKAVVDATKGANQHFFGGDGRDSFLGGTGSNEFQAGSGAALMDGHLGSSGLFAGGSGNDTMIGGAGLNIFSGGEGDDSITAAVAGSVSFVDGGDGNEPPASSFIPGCTRWQGRPAWLWRPRISGSTSVRRCTRLRR